MQPWVFSYVGQEIPIIFICCFKLKFLSLVKVTEKDSFLTDILTQANPLAATG